MDASKWIFNHHSWVEKENQSFVKQHQKPMNELEMGIGIVWNCTKNVNEESLPSSLKVTPWISKAQEQISFCSRIVDNILSKKNVTGTSTELPKYESITPIYEEALDQEAKEIDNAYDKEFEDLKTVYSQMKENLNFHT